MRTIPSGLRSLTIVSTWRFLLIVTCVLSACSGDDPVRPDPAIALSVSPATISLQQGRGDSVVVLVESLNGFASTVTLSVEGVPAGVVTGFTLGSASIPLLANGGTATGLWITVNASAAPGNHTLTVRARSQGVDDQTARVTLTVIHAPATLALSLTPTARTIAPGQSAAVTASITRGGSFTGAVDLSAEGVLPGVTVSFDPASIPAGVSTSTVTIAAASSATQGQYAIVVRAKGQGVTDQIATLALTVAAPGVSLSVSPATAIVEAGGRVAVEVRLTRTGSFTGAVTFALEDAPAGVTGTFTPNPQPGTRSALTIDVAPGTPPGVYTLRVKGTSPGVPDAVATLPLQITAAGGARNVSFRFCAARPIWVASQDDAGPWTRVAAGPNETYSFNVSSRGGVAIVRPFGSAYRIDVVYATATELAEIGSTWDPSCSAPVGTKQLSGTLAGVAGQEVSISLGPRSASVSQDRTSYTLRNVPDGALDLVASRGHAAGLFDFDATKLIIRRGLDLPNGATIPVLDFNAAEAVTPVPSSLTLTGVGSDELSWLMTYMTAGGTEELLNGHLFGSPVSTLSYAGVPTSLQSPGDLHVLFVEGAASNDLRRLFTAFHRAENRSVALGPQLATPTVSVVATSPYLRHRMLLPPQTEYGSEVVGRFVQPSTLATSEVAATAAYFGGSPPQWDLTVPDLTAAAGFDPAWGLRPGAATEWEAFATSGSFLIASLPNDGETIRMAGRWDGAPPASIAARRSLGVQSTRGLLRALRAVRGAP
jgi:P2-related tail formation protein